MTLPRPDCPGKDLYGKTAVCTSLQGWSRSLTIGKAYTLARPIHGCPCGGQIGVQENDVGSTHASKRYSIYMFTLPEDMEDET